MNCFETIQAYAFRAVGIGERLLPKADITFCEQVVLIGSGMIWNIYFGVLAIMFGFFAATLVALARFQGPVWLRWPAQAFVYVFRGSPLFIQFFFAYELLVLLPRAGLDIHLGFAEITMATSWLTKAWAGALIVLFLNTTAYSAEIFYGALRSLPRGDLEAADAYGMSGWVRFRRIVWPNLLRLAWPAYTNEAIFLFHATTLVYFSGFPAWRQQGDALYYASYFAEKTFNPFVAYPIVAMYFIAITLCIIALFGWVNRRLNQHLMPENRQTFRFQPQWLR